jgi:DNA-binding NtrC family response regulator
LVVDDEPSMRAALMKVLQLLLGYSVHLAADAEQALALLDTCETAFSVVISDRILPGMSGDDMLVRIAELWPSTPVVLMSGDVGGFRELDSVPPGAGAVRCIKKPFTSQELARVLAEAVTGTGRETGSTTRFGGVIGDATGSSKGAIGPFELAGRIIQNNR